MNEKTTKPQPKHHRKMRKNIKRQASKKEKNVMNVMKAEDIDGHNADIDINSVLEVIIYRGNGRIYSFIDANILEYWRESG